VLFAITRSPSRGASTVLIQDHPPVSTSTNLAAIGANIRSWPHWALWTVADQPQEELDRWERVIPIMNELLEAKGLKKVAEGAVWVTGLKGPLEEGWQHKVPAFADQIML
jgi:hypothetical protein